MKKALVSIAATALAVPGAAHAAETAADWPIKVGTASCYVIVDEPARILTSYPPQIVVNPRFVSYYCPNT